MLGMGWEVVGVETKGKRRLWEEEVGTLTGTDDVGFSKTATSLLVVMWRGKERGIMVEDVRISLSLNMY